MNKYKYIYFGDDISKQVEREYNRLCRKEQYQAERDRKHGVHVLTYDPFLYSVADITLTEEYQAEIQAELQWEQKLEILPRALKWLERYYFDEYKLIKDYYYSDCEITLDSLSEQYGITKQALSKRLSAVRERLKKFIIKHESKV
ncbi:MAG: hypothetical protein IKI37_05710 [Oscillospiraceae bacterium]|nr:hypothetical protein [Oscillospiraceae bacterium]